MEGGKAGRQRTATQPGQDVGEGPGEDYGLREISLGAAKGRRGHLGKHGAGQLRLQRMGTLLRASHDAVKKGRYGSDPKTSLL